MNGEGTVTPDNLVAKVSALTAIVRVSRDNQDKVMEKCDACLDALVGVQVDFGERISVIEGETKATRELVTTLLNRPQSAKRNFKQDALVMGGGGIGLASIIEVIQRYMGQ